METRNSKSTGPANSKLRSRGSQQREPSFPTNDAVFDPKFQFRILVVDDSLTIRMQIKDLLLENGFDVMLAEDGPGCLRVMEEKRPDVILLDIIMPGMDGIEVCRRIKDDERLGDIPILILTNVTDVDNKVRGLNAGADDYITKPFSVEELVARVDSVIRTKAILEQLKEEVRFRSDAENRLRRANRKLEESTGELKKRMEELEQSKKIIEEKSNLLQMLSTRDTLTGLHNRLHMEVVVGREFKRAQRYGTNLSFLMLDLDFFKNINDFYGHAFGDFVLREFASDLKKHARDSDGLFRYGGEEFLAVLSNTDMDGAFRAAELIRKRCETRTFDFRDHSINVSVSIGVSSVRDHRPASVEEVLSFADKALYQAKAEGRNRVCAYHADASMIPEQHNPNGVSLNDLKTHLSAILEKTKNSSISSLELLVRRLGDARFPNHQKEVAQYMELMGNKLNLPPNIVETFKRAASLHDCFCNALLGKSLIMKKGPLDEEERQRVKDHPYMLADLTQVFDFFAKEKSVLLYHHENYDGSGYPDGLSGDQIPVGARLYAIIDALVSMSSERSYREKLSPEQMLDQLARNAGKQFDPLLVNLFMDVIEEHRLFNVGEEALRKAKDKINMAGAFRAGAIGL